MARWLLPAALAIVALAFEGYLLADRQSRTYAVIKIRWADEVTDAGRATHERDLDLRAPQVDAGPVWAYRLYAPTTVSLSRVVAHPAVADTAYVDRSVYVPDRVFVDPLLMVTRWLRWGLWALPLVAGVAAAGAIRASRRALVHGWRLGGSAVSIGLAGSAAFIRTAFADARRFERRARERVTAPVVRSLTRRSRPAQACLLFSLGFVPLAGWSVAADARHPEWRRGSIYERGLRLPSGGEFLSQDPELLDHDVYYHGLHGWVEHARRADVIFTGNSRAVYAFRTEAVKPHFDRLGLKYYNLAFAGGADKFPLALMRRYDIWPKVLVINVHGFFDDDYTRFGVWAMARDWFTGWNFVWERQASWNLRYSLHRMLPHWPTLNVHRKASQVIYRDVTDGSWRWVLPIIVPMPLGNVPARDWANERERLDIEKWGTRIATNAPGYIAELESHGTAVVLVFVPVPDAVTYYSAVEGAAALGRPLVVSWPAGLMGASGSHMGLASARRYVDGLMPKLLAMDEFRTILPAQAGTR